jgi:hypothetical protein
VAEPDQCPAQANPQRPARRPERTHVFRPAHLVRQPVLGQPHRNLLMEIHQTTLSYRLAAAAKVSTCNFTDVPKPAARSPSGVMLRTFR